tara:strand:- start:2216 stop:2452 length:237 start_codon:yes stop_codon:yes gene_type:complete
MKANGEYIILKCEEGRTASGIILDATKNKGKIISKGESTPNRLKVGGEVIFQNGSNFSYEGEEYVAVAHKNILAILGD